MVKPAEPGVYSATYSNIPVYEFQFGEGLKEHVMRRRADDWINATHILKAAGFDKPARTRILEREVQKETHEKVQGGYGKYQGTWVPLEQGEALAQRNNVYEKLRTIFEFHPGNVSPPPAPKHTTAKPKVPKRPAVPKFGTKPVAAPVRQQPIEEDYDNISAQLNDDESIADDMTVASSYMDIDDRYDVSQQSTGHRKRKREDRIQTAHEAAHQMYADELLDYFMLAHGTAPKPEPPINFHPDWIIDQDGHAALHWAAAMGDIEIVRELKRFGANLEPANNRGETPLMRCVLFTNCQDKQTMPAIVKELIDTIDCVDKFRSTALHHATAMCSSRQKHATARYYLDVILNKMQETMDQDTVQNILDARDIEGNTAMHIAAMNGAKKCIRALIGRGARTDIKNNEGVTLEDLLIDLNNSRKPDRQRHASSSPYGPERSIRELPEEPRTLTHHVSEAAMSIQSKIAPAILEKFHALASSFDEELEEKETSEKEARRILNTTIAESAATNQQLKDLSYHREMPEAKAIGEEQLAFSKQKVISTIEQQQKIQLLAQVQVEENNSKANGQITTGDDVAERTMLADMLRQEQNKRQKLVGDFIHARSMAGAGEKGELYRRVIAQALGGGEISEVDENLNSLVQELTEESQDRRGETIDM